MREGEGLEDDKKKPPCITNTPILLACGVLLFCQQQATGVLVVSISEGWVGEQNPLNHLTYPLLLSFTMSTCFMQLDKAPFAHLLHHHVKISSLLDNPIPPAMTLYPHGQWLLPQRVRTRLVVVRLCSYSKKWDSIFNSEIGTFISKPC